MCDFIAPRWFEFYIYPDPSPFPFGLLGLKCLDLFVCGKTLSTIDSYGFSRAFLLLVKIPLNFNPSSPESSPHEMSLC